MIQGFFNLFWTVDFVSVGLTLLAGAIWGFLFRNWEIDKRTVFVLISLYVPLLLGRILYTISGGEDNSGVNLGLIYYTIYFVGAMLTRRLFHGKIVDSIPDTFKNIKF